VVGQTTGAQIKITLKVKNTSTSTSSEIGGGLEAKWDSGAYSAGGSTSFKSTLAEQKDYSSSDCTLESYGTIN